MGEWLEIAPAYGRIYTTQAQVHKDWNAEKDFKLTTTGQYLNKPQVVGANIIVRYGKNLEKVMSL